MKYLELFLDLPPEIFPQLLQFLRKRRVREMSLDSIFDRELVEQTEREIVILKYKDDQKQILRIIKITQLRAVKRAIKRFSK